MFTDCDSASDLSTGLLDCWSFESASFFEKENLLMGSLLIRVLWMLESLAVKSTLDSRVRFFDVAGFGALEDLDTATGWSFSPSKESFMGSFGGGYSFVGSFFSLSITLSEVSLRFFNASFFSRNLISTSSLNFFKKSSLRLSFLSALLLIRSCTNIAGDFLGRVSSITF